jgi:diguanylate cyclase (GGDEF)-like protein
VLNRRAWDQALASAVRKGSGPLYIALLDLDHFKGYNDRNGHPAGDDLLRRAATAWRSAVRAVDVVARYGGEEFAVLLAGCEEDVALDIAERLRLATIDEQRVSIGLARWDGMENPASLVDRADHALYSAKRAGRNRVMIAP